MRTFRVLSAGLMLVVVFRSLVGCSSRQQAVFDRESISVHTYQIDGLTVQTGDLICTNTTEGPSVFGRFFYRTFGMAIPGPVDHIVVYVGPGGRCVEAGARLRVLTFDVAGGAWDSLKMAKGRGPIYDTLCGVAYPLAGRSLSREGEESIRKAVAVYCLRQAQARKPYNALFTNSATDKAFYCSQLAYKAYLEQGIDLNTGQGVAADVPFNDKIVFPQEIWAGCDHVRAPGWSADLDQRIP